MLLDDSIELECNDSSATPEPLPVNWDIDLSKIWIPSSVLPNRKKQINLNENKPFVLYTLEKPDYSKTFSTYSDECPQHNESQTSSAVLSRISPHKLLNDNNNKDEIQQALTSFENAVEWDGRLDIDSENVISPKLPLNNKSDDSLRDCQEAYNSTIRNATKWEKDSYAVKDVIYRASLEDLTRRMAEILSEDEPLRENWHHDVINTNQGTTDSTLDSIPPSTKDSLEELYYSDEDENQFAEEYELDNLELESPDKKPTCSIYTENSYFQEQKLESFANSLTQVEEGSDKTVSQSSEETEKIQCQKVAIDNEFNRNEDDEQNRIEVVVAAKDSEQELLSYEGKVEDKIEKVPEFPIAYKRPPLQEQTNKAKQQKEKKKSKKAKKNIPLEDLFVSDEVDRFKVPEVDEFYENLVRQGKCKPCNQEINISEFPSVNVTEKLQIDADEFPSIVLPDPSQNLVWVSEQKLSQILSDEHQSNSLAEITRNEDKAEPELDTKDSLNTLVIENIPLNVSKETIEGFILGYGELKNLTVERLRKFQRAKLQMNFTHEVDWIIDCLHGSQPFGSFDQEPIKCYRQT